jgi:hypothetical protein
MGFQYPVVLSIATWVTPRRGGVHLLDVVVGVGCASGHVRAYHVVLAIQRVDAISGLDEPAR